MLPLASMAAGVAAAGVPPWAADFATGLAELKAGLAELKAGQAATHAKMLNQAVSLPGDPISAIPSSEAPYWLPNAGPNPLVFPATLEQLALASRAQVAPLLAFYHLAPMHPLGHGAAAEHPDGPDDAEMVALRAGQSRLGSHLGIAMGTSRERLSQLREVRAFNASAHVHEHELEPQRGAFPPFFLPREAGVASPVTAAEFHRMSLADARALSDFYGLRRHHGETELNSRLRDIARHIGYRFF